ncbi:Tellurite resistance protein [Staphylococcus aureus]|uniref:Tellurite resistance protein n=1 Tax=Staphylococcus aureus TaxID=1280 RepID=A0A2X2JW56_STAAU|nr:Tellurite resistance protein [Staphylococcus aureus]
MAIALTLMRQRNAVAAQRAVTDTTNDLLTANAEMLKQNAIETATENERGIVDLDTLKRTQRNIIETIEETLIIQQHGREERQLAEKELQQLEQDLKSHLVNTKDRINNHKLRIRYNKKGSILRLNWRCFLFSLFLLIFNWILFYKYAD